MAYILDGTYTAEGISASVYRKPENGNVILCTEWGIPDLHKTIRNWDCLIDGATGAIREKALAGVKKWAVGWDGTTFSWFAQNITSLQAELVIVNEPRRPPEYDENGNPKTVSRVKWINPIGGGGGNSKEIAADESAELDRLFSARLRANAGARPVATVPTAPKPASSPSVPKPTAPKPPAPAPKPPKTTQKPDSAPSAASGDAGGNDDTPATQESVWARFCAYAKKMGWSDKERNDSFLGLVNQIGKLPDYDNWTAADWAKLDEEVAQFESLPF